MQAAIETALINQGLAANAAEADALVAVSTVTDDNGNERLVLSSGRELQFTNPNATAVELGFAKGQSNRRAGFATVQEMLAASGPLTASYDADGNLKFSYSGSYDQSPYTKPFAFDQSFDAISGVVVHADVQADSSVTVQFTYGVDLTPAAGTAQLVGSAENRLPQSGVLSDDAHFTVVATINSAPTAVDVTVARDATNTSIADLVADIQTAVDAAVVTAGGSAGDVTVDTDPDASGYRLTFTQAGQPVTVSVSDPADPAAGELGLGAPRSGIATPVTGAYAPGETIAFGLVLGETLPMANVVVGDGTVYPATFAHDGQANPYFGHSDDLTDNTSLADLVDDLNAAISNALDQAGYDHDLVVASAYGDGQIAPDAQERRVAERAADRADGPRQRQHPRRRLRESPGGHHRAPRRLLRGPVGHVGDRRGDGQPCRADHDHRHGHRAGQRTAQC